MLTRLVLDLLDAWIYTEGPGIGLVPRKSHALLYRQTKFQLVTQHWLPIDILKISHYVKKGHGFLLGTYSDE